MADKAEAAQPEPTPQPDPRLVTLASVPLPLKVGRKAK